MSIYKEEGLKAGYLKDEIYLLKPLNRGLVVTDSLTKTEFPLLEGAVKGFVPLLKTSGREYHTPFSSIDEQRYFEKVLGVKNLDAVVGNEFWDNFVIRINYDRINIINGKMYDMSEPMDNITVKILKTLPTIALSEDESHEIGKEFILFESNTKVSKAAKTAEKKQKAFKLFATIADSYEKMREFIEIYKLDKKELSISISDNTKEFLISEIYNIIENDVDGFILVLTDENYNSKVILNKALKANIIERKGVNNYNIIGTPNNITYEHIISLLSNSITDEYHAVREQILLNENKYTNESSVKEKKVKNKSV